MFMRLMITPSSSLSYRSLLTGAGLFATLAALASPPPTFTTNPSSQAVLAGSVATFTVAATGSPAYQWYAAYNGVTNLIAGASGTSLAVTGYYTNQQSYFCVASNSAGTATSSIVTLGLSFSWSPYGYLSSSQTYRVPF